MRTRRYRCDDCIHLHCTGETMVPYGDTWVSMGDEYECDLGYDVNRGDCEDEDYEPDDESYYPRAKVTV